MHVGHKSNMGGSKEHQQWQNLYLHNNQLTKLPIAITQITSLEILDISFNPIVEIPNDVSKLKNLKKLELP